MEDAGTLPSKSSPEEMLRFTSSKNHAFWVETTSGEAILLGPDGDWFYLSAERVSDMEVLWKRVPVETL